ncbi:MAG: histidine kinase, partial [Actinomycetota bacterium]
MKDLTSRRVAWTIWTTSIGLGILTSVIYAVGYPASAIHTRFSTQVLLVIGLVVTATLGNFLARRQPDNPIAWIFAVLGLAFALGAFLNHYAAHALVIRPGTLPAGEWVSVIGAAVVPPSLWVPVTFFLLLFPNGRLLSRRWRIVAGLTILTIPLVATSNVLTPGPLLAGGPPNPLGLEGSRALLETIGNFSWLTAGICLALAALSLVLRFRRSEGIERQQLKWMALSASLVMLGMGISVILAPFSIDSSLLDALSLSLTILGLASVPITASIAILKYRLYEIDVIINKTVVYGGLAGFITSVYVGVVVGIGTLVGAGDKPNLGLSLVATAIVAVAFQPVRERVQRFANKLVYGERVTPYEAITGFSHRMAESLSLDSVLPQMAEAAAKGVGGVRSRVTLMLPGGGEQMADWPGDSPGDSSDNSFDRTLAVVHQGEQMGEISVSKSPGEQINKNEDKLLSDLASQAGLAMRNLRLTAELQQKLVELQASRQRIVKAQDEERRRMERDIHDGAQQQLVSMSVKLGLVGNLLGRDVDKA